MDCPKCLEKKYNPKWTDADEAIPAYVGHETRTDYDGAGKHRVVSRHSNTEYYRCDFCKIFFRVMVLHVKGNALLRIYDANRTIKNLMEKWQFAKDDKPEYKEYELY